MLLKENKNFNHLMIQLSFFSIVCFCLFIYSSLAATSLGHIFLILPGLYFTFLGMSFDLPRSAKFLGAFIIVGLLSIFLGETIDNPGKRIGELRYFLSGILSIWAFTAAFTKYSSNKTFRFLLLAVLLVASTASINGIIGLYTGHNPLRFKPTTDPARATGLYSMAITFGYGIQFLTLITAGLIVYRRKLIGIISQTELIISFFCVLCGLYFSGSRGALLGFILGFPFIFFRNSKKKFFLVMASIILILSAATFIVFTGGSNYTRFLLPADHDSNKIRISQYQAAFIAIKERPWIGHGYRHFKIESERIKIENNLRFQDFIDHAHNNYLEIFADTGIFGLLFFSLFHFFWALESIRRRDFVGDIALSICFAFFISGMFQCTIIDAENTFAIMFIYGLSQVTKERISYLKSTLSL